MRRTESLEIDGMEYTVRPLNMKEMTSISNFDDTADLLAFIVMAGTIVPKFETIDDIPLNVALDLASRIQEITLDEVNKIASPRPVDSGNPFVV